MSVGALGIQAHTSPFELYDHFQVTLKVFHLSVPSVYIDIRIKELETYLQRISDI